MPSTPPRWFFRCALWAMGSTAAAAAPSLPSAGLPDDGATQVLAEVAPRVEAIAGLKLLHTPRVRRLPREALTTALTDHFDCLAVLPGGEDVGPRRAAHDALLAQVAVAPALYVHHDETVYVFEESLDSLRTGAWKGMAPEASALRCWLALETTHALQHQHADATLRASDGSRLFWDGYAEHVAQLACDDPQGTRFQEVLQGTDLLPSVTAAQLHPRTFGLGQRFAAAYVARHGHAAAWWALNQPLPAVQPLWEAVAASVDPSWRDDAQLHPALDLLEARRVPGDVVPGALTGIAFQLSQGSVPLASLARSDAGLTFRGPTARGPLWASVLVARDPQAALAWIRRRAEQVAQSAAEGAPITFLVDPGGATKRVRVDELGPLRKRTPLDAQLRVRATGAKAYQELWAVRGHRVAVVASTGRSPRTADLVDAVDLLLGEDTGPALYPLDQVALDRVTALADPPRDHKPQPHWRYEVQRVRQLALWDEPTACVDAALQRAPTLPSPAQQQVMQIGTWCATQAPDAAPVFTLVRTPGWIASLPEALQIDLAERLVQLGKPAEAWDLAEQLDLTTTPSTHSAASFLLALALELKRPMDIWRFGHDKNADATLRYAAGGWLVNQGHFSQGMKVLSGVCWDLEGAEQEACTRWLEALQ